MLAFRSYCAVLVALTACGQRASHEPAKDAGIAISDAFVAPADAGPQTPDITWSTALGSELIDGAAVLDDRMYILGQDLPDARHVVRFALYTLRPIDPPVEEVFSSVDSVEGSISVSGHSVLMSWFEQHGRSPRDRQVTFVRRGDAPDKWSVPLKLPGDDFSLGKPWLAPGRNGGWVMCFDTQALVYCSDVAAASRQVTPWRLIKPLASVMTWALCATPDATWLVADCDKGSCKDHSFVVNVDVGAKEHFDLGEMRAPKAVALGSDCLVASNASSTDRYVLVSRTGIRSVDLNVPTYITRVPRQGGLWLVDKDRYQPWSEATGLGATTVWNREVIERRLLGEVHRVILAPPDGVLFIGQFNNALTVIGLRLPGHAI
jgi:hypothetical protein